MDRQPNHDWRVFLSKGSGATLDSGCAVTANTDSDCPSYWLSGDTTIILGATAMSSEKNEEETVASWNIYVDAGTLRHFSQAFLVVACIRRLGGLHTYIHNSRVDIFLNAKQVDGFALRITAQGHSDYFHRIPDPEYLPSLPPTSACQTRYAWFLPKAVLSKTGTQIVKIRIDRDVRWDIDYVSLMMQTRAATPQVFVSYSWHDKELATRLVNALEDLDIDVWFDEGNMTIGSQPEAETRKAIKEVRYVVVLLSEHSLKSESVTREIDIALEIEEEIQRVKVLPLVLDACSVPSALKNRLYDRLLSADELDRVAARIDARLRL